MRLALLLLLLLATLASLTSAGFAPTTMKGLGVLRKIQLPFLSPNVPGKQQPKKPQKPVQKKKITRRRSLAAVMMLTGRAWMGCILLALPRFSVSIYRSLPSKLPKFWQTPSHWITKNQAGQALFLLSNVAYLYAGWHLLAFGAPRVLGYSVLACCAASIAYHAAQCLHGTGSPPPARFCQIDTFLAVSTGLLFLSSVHIDATNVALALLSLAFFNDTFGLGYTVSHSMWHFSTATAAVVSRVRNEPVHARS